MILLNGQPESRINIVDRGLQYGDGVFETVPFRHNRLEFLQAHLDRLFQGCQRLNIPYLANDLLINELNQVCDSLVNTDAVVKIIITRGQGGRGYRADEHMVPTRIISTHDMPNYSKTNRQGIRVRLCQQTLSENKSLAGIKHLNRLEQVLARSEWRDDEISEGLMFDQHQQLIEGTMTNIFIVQKGTLLTPDLSKSGIKGIMRDQIINCANKLDIDVTQTNLSQQDLLEADEVFVSNSLIDIWPVIKVDDLIADIEYGKITKSLQQALQDLVR